MNSTSFSLFLDFKLLAMHYHNSFLHYCIICTACIIPNWGVAISLKLKGINYQRVPLFRDDTEENGHPYISIASDEQTSLVIYTDKL